MEDARRHYLDLIRTDGVPLSPALAQAFATVPREVFVPDGFLARDGRRVLPADPEFLPTVYSNDVLVTKLSEGRPVSSSSQPSLMAIMIGALDPRPGMRILEIGAGTGYNAALLAALGATVTTVDVQPDVAARARSALARAGVSGVRVETADGYTAAFAGDPERYDRIIVTVGVAGVSPHWLDRLEPGGRIIVPVEHGGTHPVLDVREQGAATVVCPAGFMSASGPLTARRRHSHPEPVLGMEGLTGSRPSCWRPPLEALAYRDLWYAAGAWHHRVTQAARPDRQQSCLAVLDESGESGAVVLADGAILASGAERDRYAAIGAALADRWDALERPPMSAWDVELAPSGPLWTPYRWTLRHRRAEDSPQPAEDSPQPAEDSPQPAEDGPRAA
ncbi:methyltransferase domain-containing protein [Actinoplanes sp. NPDC049802]|uniref:protein-L-isoaspartate O-methyltransferase family protein n=1 Tax=Actinoplanes sp. NPDC049802 TaxID=3154742 RepID=UPI0033EA8574